MWVVKLGGSIIGSPELPRWIDAIADAGRGHRMVIVAGGGIFVDTVRGAQTVLGIDDATAHAMALLGMRQFAVALTGARADGLTDLAEIRLAGASNGVSVWDPDDAALAASQLPQNWRVTSDSLSLWLCGELAGAQLILVKSRVPQRLESPGSEPFVDEYFYSLLRSSRVNVWWLERSQLPEFADLLRGVAMPQNRLLAPA
jgi:aspartokinase-like uncharacterized kinase